MCRHVFIENVPASLKGLHSTVTSRHQNFSLPEVPIPQSLTKPFKVVKSFPPCQRRSLLQCRQRMTLGKYIKVTKLSLISFHIYRKFVPFVFEYKLLQSENNDQMYQLYSSGGGQSSQPDVPLQERDQSGEEGF